MNYFLAKTEPTTYSIDDLARERTTTWNGVRNAQAVTALKAMKKGDTVFIYHSQSLNTGIVGIAKVAGNSRPDPNDTKSWLIDLRFIKKLPEPILLSTIKSQEKFKNFALIKQSRLSTMPVPQAVVDWLNKQGVKC